MKACKMKLADLKMPERNVRIHTEQQIKEYEKSVRMFGQLRPMVVDEENTILSGNGLFIVMKNLGYEEADVYKIEDLTPNQKKKLMIADNRIFSLGVENLETLNEFLNELTGDLDIPGFDEELLRQMTADAQEITEEIGRYGTMDAEDIQRVRDNAVKKAAKEVSGSEPEPAGESEETEHGDDNQAEKSGEFVICPKCGEKIWL